MIVVSGQVKRETCMGSYPDLHVRQLGDQETDIVPMVEGITKYAVCLIEPGRGPLPRRAGAVPGDITAGRVPCGSTSPSTCRAPWSTRAALVGYEAGSRVPATAAADVAADGTGPCSIGWRSPSVP